MATVTAMDMVAAAASLYAICSVQKENKEIVKLKFFIMKKFLIAGALCAMMIFPAAAQEVSARKGAPAKANWFVSAGFGGQVYLGDHDRQVEVGKRITPALDIAVGKWFTPSIGLRLMYSGLSAKGATQNGVHSTGEVMPGEKGGWGYWLSYQKFNEFSISAEVLFNLNNVFAGYREDRVWSCCPYVGIGYARVTDEPVANGYLIRGGLFNSFRVAKAWAVNLDLRAGYLGDDFDGEVGGRSGDGLLTATVGVTYKFGPRGWNR